MRSYLSLSLIAMKHLNNWVTSFGVANTVETHELDYSNETP